MRATLVRALWSCLAGFGVGAVLSVSWWLIIERPARAAEDVVIEIPSGTAAAVARGEPPLSIPSLLNLRPGDRLVVLNQDSDVHLLGNLTIPAGSRASVSAGVFLTASSDRFLCSFHGAGSIGVARAAGGSPAMALWSVPIIGLPLAAVSFGITTVLARL